MRVYLLNEMKLQLRAEQSVLFADQIIVTIDEPKNNLELGLSRSKGLVLIDAMVFPLSSR